MNNLKKRIKELSQKDIDLLTKESIDMIIKYIIKNKVIVNYSILQELVSSIDNIINNSVKELKSENAKLKEKDEWLISTIENLKRENVYLRECEERLIKITSSKIYKLYEFLKKII
jgi:uncharacterized protein (UPF0305 family)